MNSRLNRPPMGIATEKSYSNKKYYAKFLDVFNSGSIASIESACLGIFAEDADIHASHQLIRLAVKMAISKILLLQ